MICIFLPSVPSVHTNTGKEYWAWHTSPRECAGPDEESITVRFRMISFRWNQEIKFTSTASHALFGGQIGDLPYGICGGPGKLSASENFIFSDARR
jgi:hypothetical protein